MKAHRDLGDVIIEWHNHRDVCKQCNHLYLGITYREEMCKTGRIILSKYIDQLRLKHITKILGNNK